MTWAPGGLQDPQEVCKVKIIMIALNVSCRFHCVAICSDATQATGWGWRVGKTAVTLTQSMALAQAAPPVIDSSLLSVMGWKKKGQFFRESVLGKTV